VSLTSVDLLEELRAALDELEPLLAGRVVDIEMSRVRVLADRELFRREFASLIESAVADAKPTDPVTVRVARTGKAAEIEVLYDRGGTRSEVVVGSMRVPLEAGASSAADG
jgi:light-regulated signal transduction histidine kinase (bacteriophytochrome)